MAAGYHAAGEGAMVWEGRREGAAGCARGHIVGEGIRPNWAHLAHLKFEKMINLK